MSHHNHLPEIPGLGFLKPIGFLGGLVGAVHHLPRVDLADRLIGLMSATASLCIGAAALWNAYSAWLKARQGRASRAETNG